MDARLTGAGMAINGVADAVRAIYGVAEAANEFIDRHVDRLKQSDQPHIALTGRVLESMKAGFTVGYVGCVAVVVIGQLILGHPLVAFGVALKSAVAMNPVAITCGAIGAIVYGWAALSEEERERFISRAVQVLDLASDTVRKLVHFVLSSARKAGQSPVVAALKASVKAQAQEWGRTLGDVTRKTVDRVADTVSKAPAPALLATGNADLLPVLERMGAKELQAILQKPFNEKAPSDASEAQLRQRLFEQVTAAGSSSLPLSRTATYGEILVDVARHLKVPVPLAADASLVEHQVLFKVLQLSVEKMSDEQRRTFLEAVQKDLDEKGVSGKVSLDQLMTFIKFAGMDLGGSLTTLVMTAPGIAGIAGLNILQLAVLKGIILTSGYFTAGTAILGFGTGGALMAAAGAAGPIGGGLIVIYTLYRISGPAYRKLVPAVCAIASKRIEIAVQAGR